MSQNTIEVRFRHEGDTKARHLCFWPATELDSIIPTIERWGLLGDDGASLVEPPSLYAQFVLTGTEAYFEVVIAEDDDQ